MKNLIIYYSYEGNTEKLVEGLKESIDADVICLKLKKENKTNSLFRFVWGAKQVYMSKTPEIEPVQVNFSKYDKIFIGSPCWFGTFAPPLKTFLRDYKFENKDVAIFICNGGNLRHTHQDLKESLKGNNIIDIKDFIYPIKNGIKDAQKELIDWAKKII